LGQKRAKRISRRAKKKPGGMGEGAGLSTQSVAALSSAGEPKPGDRIGGPHSTKSAPTVFVRLLKGVRPTNGSREL
jgi:hypothetical protein